MRCTANRDVASACVGRVIAWGPEMLLWNHGEDWIMEGALASIALLIIINSSSVKMEKYLLGC